MGKKQRPKFYVVWKGHQPGIYTNWAECQQQVSGYSGAEFKSFPTRAEAETALAGEYRQHIGRTSPVKQSPIPREQWAEQGVILDSICVDAACSGNPGVLEYRGVETASGELLFDAGPFEQGTVNIGEFLAIVQALGLLKLEQRSCPIYSDSTTAMTWVRKRCANTQLPRTAVNDPLFQMIEWAERLLRENDYPNRILKWQTGHWGEIPADYGRK